MAKTKPASTAAKEPGSVGYVATRHVNHDNTDYEAGDPIELDEKAAAALLEVDAIEVMAE